MGRITANGAPQSLAYGLPLLTFFASAWAAAETPTPEEDLLHAYDAHLIRAVVPTYPAEAAEARIEGRVTIAFDIVRPGIAAQVSLIENDPPGTFEAAVLDALQYWRFQPAGVGQTTRVIVAETFPETITGEGYMEYMRNYSPVPSKSACITVPQSATQSFIFEISDPDEPVKLGALVLDPPVNKRHNWRPIDTVAEFAKAADSLRAAYPHPFMTNVQPKRMIEPLYPAYWREVGEQGYVTLAFELQENGKLKKLTLLEEYPPDIFNRDARIAVKRWRYEPILINGKPARGTICQTIEFRLHPEEHFQQDTTEH